MRRDGRAFVGMEHLEGRTLLATVTWDGGGGDLSWHNPQNWSGDVLPGVNDDVIINVAGSNPTITHSQNVTTRVKTIVSNERLSISGGTVETSGRFRANGPLDLGGGAIAGAGNLELFSALNWSGGQIIGAGKVQVLLTGKITITGTVTLGRLLVNNGVVNWTAGNWRFTGGTLFNLAGRAVNLQSSGTIVDVSGSNLITNAGSLLRNGTSTTTTLVEVRTNSTGTIDVRQGRLSLTGGGNAVNGTVRAGANSLLVLSGVGFQVAVNGVLTGPGTVQLENGNHWILGTVNDLAKLIVNGAGLNYQGAGSVRTLSFLAGLITDGTTLTVSESMTWNGGTLTGNGRLIIGSSAVLAASGGATKGLGATLDNNGTVTWSAGTLRMTGGTIVNKGTFTVDTQRFFSGGGTNLVTNAGTFVKAGGGAMVFETIAGGVRFVNQPGSILRLDAGTLQLHGGGTNSGSITGSAQSSLIFDWLTFVHAAGSINDIPSVTIAGTVQWTGGSIAGAGLLIVSGTGSFTLAGSGTKTLSRSVANSGVMTWLAGNLALEFITITVGTNGTLTFGSTGTLMTTGGLSTINNSGTLNKSGTGALALASEQVRVSNNGTLAVLGGSLTFGAAQVTNYSGNVLTGGVWVIQGGATLAIQGAEIHTNNAEVRLRGAGSAFTALAGLRGNGGLLALENGADLSVTPGNGTFVNGGQLILSPGAEFNITGGLILGTTSVVDVQIASASSFGRIVASGSGRMGGEARATYQFAPQVGALFAFFTGSSRIAGFSATTWTGLAGSLISPVKLSATVSEFEIRTA